MAKIHRKTYPIDQSPLFRVTTKRRLAAVLGMTERDIRLLVSLPDNYRVWSLPQKRQDRLAGLEPKKPRQISQPKSVLDVVHRRVASLLARIEKPDFVFSATKGRDYVANARRHMNAHRGVKVDIRDFYPYVRSRLVRKFFEKRLQCAPDVAAVLARLCCLDSALPTGSSISPVLSYFACSEMFDRVAAMADSQGLAFSLYVDDMMFSGEDATREFAGRVCRVLSEYGFCGHKISYFPAGAVKVVTGVAVWRDRVSLPSRRFRKIRLYRAAMRRQSRFQDANTLAKTLVGHFREAERLQPGSRAQARQVQREIERIRAKLGPANEPGETDVGVRRPRRRIPPAALNAKIELLREMRRSRSSRLASPNDGASECQLGP